MVPPNTAAFEIGSTKDVSMNISNSIMYSDLGQYLTAAQQMIQGFR